MIELLTVASILGAGLLAGGLMAVALAVVPLIKKLERRDYVRLHQGLDAEFDPFMPILNVATLLLAVGWLVVAPSGWQRAAVAFGLAMELTVALISSLGNSPINKQVGGWHPDQAFPVNAEDTLRRWKGLHQLRTAAAIIGFLALGVGGVVGS